MELCFEHRVAVPRDTLFRFHENPANLRLLMADQSACRLLRHDSSILPGSTLWMEQTMAGCVPVVMGFQHIIYEPPLRFAEELIHGPFRVFKHIHEFESVGDHTIVRDLLTVRLSWQYGGELAVRLFVSRKMRELFALRQLSLERLVNSGELLATVRSECS